MVTISIRMVLPRVIHGTKLMLMELGTGMMLMLKVQSSETATTPSLSIISTKETRNSGQQTMFGTTIFEK